MNQTSVPMNEINNKKDPKRLRVPLILGCVFGLFTTISSIFSSSIQYSIIYISFYIILLIVAFVPFSYNVRSAALITILTAVAISSLTNSGIIGGARLYMLAAVIYASLLFSYRAGWTMIGVALSIYIIFSWLYFNGKVTLSNTDMPEATIQSWITQISSFLLIAVLMVDGIRSTQLQFDKSELLSLSYLHDLRLERTSLEERVQERTESLDKRTRQLQAVADIGRSITSYRNLSELLQQTARLIHENFGYYHVGIFLLDERRQYAVLAATNSEGGQQMLERGHQLKVGETGIVGYVAENIRARIALDVGDDATFFNNPDLPTTRSEMALPLVASGQILGVLDVQSSEARAFTEDDVSTLQILAEQIAVAIQNANLFDETQKALESSRVAYGEVSREAWMKILRTKSRIGYIATPPATIPIDSAKIEPQVAKAIDTGDLILDADGLTISVPIKIRGQVIGAIRLRKSEISEAWSQDETSLAITLSDQLSSALESARLYQDSQQRAARESLVSDISSRLSAVSQTELIIRETVQELGEALGSASVTFQLVDSLDGQQTGKGRENRSGKGGV